MRFVSKIKKKCEEYVKSLLVLFLTRDELELVVVKGREGG